MPGSEANWRTTLNSYVNETASRANGKFFFRIYNIWAEERLTAIRKSVNVQVFWIEAVRSDKMPAMLQEIQHIKLQSLRLRAENMYFRRNVQQGINQDLKHVNLQAFLKSLYRASLVSVSHTEPPIPGNDKERFRHDGTS